MTRKPDSLVADLFAAVLEVAHALVGKRWLVAYLRNLADELGASDDGTS